MPYRIAINGLGRDWSLRVACLYESTDYPELRIAAVNDVADIATLAHLLRYDSTHGRFLGEVRQLEGVLESMAIQFRSTPSLILPRLPWSELGIDLVMECSGTYTDRQTARPPAGWCQ